MTAASRSPCAKSKRGVSTYYLATEGLISVGHNSQPQPFECDGSSHCRSVCGKRCVHAEMAAIANIRRQDFTTNQVALIHVKILNRPGTANPVWLDTSGGPSCWQCSREILARGFAGIWLYHGQPVVPDHNERGWVFYEAEAFHRLTLSACDLDPPVVIKKLNELSDAQLEECSLPDLQRAYRELKQHHIDETTSLFNKLKELRKEK